MGKEYKHVKGIVMSEILHIETLRKKYEIGNQETNALNGVSFSVEEGRIVAIVGKSGSGKSTLLNMLGGLDTPDDGRLK